MSFAISLRTLMIAKGKHDDKLHTVLVRVRFRIHFPHTQPADTKPQALQIQIHLLEQKAHVFLDLTVDLDIVYLPDLSRNEKHTAISQPGMRYAQAEALIKTLMRDSVFQMLSLTERNVVTQRIMSAIQGRMMEDIVLLETKMAYPKREVFKLVFAKGEFDMVVFDRDAACCSIYEIKHSAEIAEAQYRHLVDKEKCEATKFRFGPIMGKYVIYRGISQKKNGIRYWNVEEYLKGLSQS